MCELITGILGSIGLAMGVGGATITTGAAAGTVVATTASVVAGGLAVAGVVGAGVAVGAAAMNAHKASKAQEAQQRAIEEKLKEQSQNSASLTNAKTATALSENSRAVRTLSSLRVPLAALNPNKSNEQAIQNVYGVDSNNVANSTKNMTGLNIAA